MALCCAAYGYRRASIAGDGIVFKSVAMFLNSFDLKCEPVSETGSMGDIHR